jgi:outer membrane lipopolysaccharide assembly protein LptE/RlpB
VTVTFRLAAACLAAVLLAGCGYGFEADPGRPPAGVYQIHIPTVANNTTYAELAYDLTNQLTRLFVLSGDLEVTEPFDADASLKAAITSVQIVGAARDRTGKASASRRVVVNLQASLVQTDQTVLWSADTITARRTYPVHGDQSTVEANLNAALNDIVMELADKVYSRVFARF